MRAGQFASASGTSASASVRIASASRSRSSQAGGRPWMPSRAPSRAPATAAFVSVSPPSETTRRSSVSTSPGRTSAWNAAPAVNRQKPWSGPSIAREPPIASTRNSSSSPPSRSATAARAERAASYAGSPRTSAATPRVTAVTAVRQRPSTCVRAERAGRELEEPFGTVRVGEAERRAVHDRAVAGRDLGAALVPDRLRRGLGGLAGRDAAQDAPGEGADVGRVGAEPLEVAFEHVGRVETAPGGERSHQVAGHRGVVGGRARGLAQPGSLEGRDRVGDVAGAQELERGSERVPEREPEGAAHDAIGEVHGGRRAYLGGPAGFVVLGGGRGSWCSGAGWGRGLGAGRLARGGQRSPTLGGGVRVLTVRTCAH